MKPITSDIASRLERILGKEYTLSIENDRHIFVKEGDTTFDFLLVPPVEDERMQNALYTKLESRVKENTSNEVYTGFIQIDPIRSTITKDPRYHSSDGDLSLKELSNKSLRMTPSDRFHVDTVNAIMSYLSNDKNIHVKEITPVHQEFEGKTYVSSEFFLIDSDTPLSKAEILFEKGNFSKPILLSPRDAYNVDSAQEKGLRTTKTEEGFPVIQYGVINDARMTENIALHNARRQIKKNNESARKHNDVYDIGAPEVLDANTEDVGLNDMNLPFAYRQIAKIYSDHYKANNTIGTGTSIYKTNPIPVEIAYFRKKFPEANIDDFAKDLFPKFDDDKKEKFIDLHQKDLVKLQLFVEPYLVAALRKSDAELPTSAKTTYLIGQNKKDSPLRRAYQTNE